MPPLQFMSNSNRPALAADKVRLEIMQSDKIASKLYILEINVRGERGKHDVTGKGLATSGAV